MRPLVFATSSEAQRLAWIRTEIGDWHGLFWNAMRAQQKDPGVAEKLLSVALHYHSASLDAASSEQRLVLESQDASLRALALQVAVARRQYARLVLRGPDGSEKGLATHHASIEASHKAFNELERKTFRT